MRGRQFAFILLLGNLVLLAIASPIHAATSGSWKSVGAMSVGRFAWFVTVLLPTGQVLVAGGNDGGNGPNLSSAELFDPTTATWVAIASMSTPRSAAAGALLPDGRVLLAGGGGATNAEVYDPTSDTWSPTLEMTTGRSAATATLLENGTVLVVGGYGSPSFAPGAESYDPQTNAWTAVAAPAFRHALHTATRLNDGRVLIAGGDSDSDAGAMAAEIYDPVSNQWSSAGSLRDLLAAGPAVGLADGRVFVLGSGDLTGMAGEIYDPATGTWTKTAYMKTATSRAFPAAAVLADGTVLVVGGIIAPGEETPTGEVYNPDTDTWSPVASMGRSRYNFSATTLRDGRVLVVGGCCEAEPPYALSSAEIFTPVLGCAVNVTDRLDVFPLSVQGIPFTPFRFQWVLIRNRTPAPIAGPLAFVMEDLQHAVSLSPFTTHCFSTSGDPFTIIVPGRDDALSPNEFALTGLLFFKTEHGSIAYSPLVLSGIPRQ